MHSVFAVMYHVHTSMLAVLYMHPGQPDLKVNSFPHTAIHSIFRIDKLFYCIIYLVREI